jgi:hypothetical protein
MVAEEGARGEGGTRGTENSYTGEKKISASDSPFLRRRFSPKRTHRLKSGTGSYAGTYKKTAAPAIDQSQDNGKSQYKRHISSASWLCRRLGGRFLASRPRMILGRVA